MEGSSIKDELGGGGGGTEPALTYNNKKWRSVCQSNWLKTKAHGICRMWVHARARQSVDVDGYQNTKKDVIALMVYARNYKLMTTDWVSEIGFLTSLRDQWHGTQVHPVTTENQFHCTRLYKSDTITRLLLLDWSRVSTKCLQATVHGGVHDMGLFFTHRHSTFLLLLLLLLLLFSYEKGPLLMTTKFSARSVKENQGFK